MTWLVDKDSMIISNYDNAFKLYNDQVDLSGTIILTTKGMKASGLAETNGSLTISKDITLKEKTFSANKGQFEILSDVVGKPALRSDYVNVDFDLEKKQAWFSPAEEGYASNNFPYLKYKTSLNDGFWDIDKKMVSMEKPYEMNIEDSYFISTKKSQDSLIFNAEKAYYYIDSMTLKVEGVEMVRIADAIVYPDGKKLEIKQDAKITTLKNAVVVMDTVHEYHTLINGEIDINSKTDLDGHADYQYVNFNSDTIPIKFSDFKWEAMKSEKGVIEYHTIARGTILEEDTFIVAPQMLFKGEVSMLAHRRLLSMDGYIKLDLKGSIKTPNWLRYENSQDVDAIRIDLESQENKNNLNLITGVHFDGVNRDYYSTFLGEKRQESDQSIFSSSGYLVHDVETKEFEVVNKNRLIDNEYAGNLFGYIESKEIYDLSGKFNLINPTPDIAHHYTFDFGGNGENYIPDSSFKLKGLALLKFEVDPKVLNQIGLKMEEMKKYLPESKTIRLGDSLYHAVGDIAGAKEALKFVNATKKAYVPLNKVVKIFESSIVLNDLNLVWDRDNKAWHSVGPIGFVSIGDYDLNMFAKAYLEIKKLPEEDQINLYLEATPDLWYNLNYSANALYIQTSDPALTTIIQSKNTQAQNMPKGMYYWAFGDEEDLTRFKTHFVADYLGGKDIEVDYSAIKQEDYETKDEFEDEFKEEETKDDKKDKEETKDPFEEDFDQDDTPQDTTTASPENKNSDSDDEFGSKEDKKSDEQTPAIGDKKDKKDKGKDKDKSTENQTEKPEQETEKSEETEQEGDTEGDEFEEDSGN
jgi:hypothetical protein